MNVKFMAGAASVVAMSVLLVGKRFERLVDATGDAATVKCALKRAPVAKNDKAEREFASFTKQPRLAVVVFYADWCFPCVDTKPLVESLGEDFRETAVVKCLDVDRCGSVLDTYGVESVPEIRFFRDGIQVDAVSGSASARELRGKFEALTGTQVPEKAPPPSALQTLFGKPASPEPASPPPSGGGTIEPMKKDWRPAGIQKR